MEAAISVREGGRAWRSGLLALALASAASTALASTPASDARAAASASFLAVGNADGVRIGATAKGYLVVETLADVGSPSAQASTTAIDNTGYAGFPWPGADVLGLQGTVNGAAGRKVADYPAAAQSDASSPKADKSNGAVTLRATSDAIGSTGLASGGVESDTGTIGHAKAVATSRHESSGTAIATANAVTEGITLGDVLHIGVTDASASVTAPIDGKLRVSSHLEVSDVRIVGQEVGFSDKGLTVAGTTTPLPDTSPLTDALAKQNITVRYLQAEKTDDGIISAGIEVTIAHDVPTLPQPVEVSYVFGRVSAAARAGGATDLGTTSGLVGGTGSIGGDATTGSVPPPSTGGGPSGGVSTPPSTVGTGAPSDEGQAPITAPPTGQPQQAANAGSALGYDPAMFYLVLVLGGVLLVGGIQLVRLFGVRVLWSE